MTLRFLPLPHWNLSRRLTAGFGLVLVLLLSITLLALQRMQRMDDHLREIVEGHNERVSRAQGMMNAIQSMTIGVVALGSSQDEEDMRYNLQEVDRAMVQYDHARDALRALARQGLQAERASQRLEKIETIGAEARTNVNSLQQLAAASTPKEVADALGTLNPRRTQDLWLQAVVQQIAHETAEAQRAYQVARASFTQARVLLIATTVAALLCGLLAASLILRSVTRPLGTAVACARRIAAGDLTGDIEVHRRDEVGDLLQALLQMQQRLRDTVGAIRLAADGMTGASAEIARGNLDLSTRTEQAAAALQQVSAAMRQVTEIAHQAFNAAHAAGEMAASASAAATTGGQAMADVVHTMDRIDASSKRIADITNVIDGIAFQTNILALNAGVEAARAGEQGRGFIVVANEVRSLAQRSADAAREIKTLIGDNVKDIEAGSQLVGRASAAMQGIVTGVAQVHEGVVQIATSASRQRVDVEQVGQAVTGLDAMTQHNAALVEEVAAAADRLKFDALRLQQTVDVFRVDA